MRVELFSNEGTELSTSLSPPMYIITWVTWTVGRPVGAKKKRSPGSRAVGSVTFWLLRNMGSASRGSRMPWDL